jgi:hypothetical protein
LKSKLYLIVEPKRFNVNQRYLNQQGISLSFQVIFAEIIQKKIPKQKVFEYTATRLRQIGNDLSMIKNKYK